MSVITGQQQDPPTSSLSFAGLTSAGIFQDDLGSVIIECAASVASLDDIPLIDLPNSSK